jgi:hypothetical protein
VSSKYRAKALTRFALDSKPCVVPLPGIPTWRGWYPNYQFPIGIECVNDIMAQIVRGGEVGFDAWTCSDGGAMSRSSNRSLSGARCGSVTRVVRHGFQLGEAAAQSRLERQPVRAMFPVLRPDLSPGVIRVMLGTHLE